MKKHFTILAVVLCVVLVVILSRTRKDERSRSSNASKAANADQGRPSHSLKPKKYFLQVANCFHESCENMYVELLRKEREPVVQELTPVTQNVYKLVSQETLSFERLNDAIDKIGYRHKALTMSLVRREEDYRLSIGSFRDLSEAKSFKARLETLFPEKDLTLEPQSSRTRRTVSKIMAGPYTSRDEANIVLKRLRSKRKFRGAFLIYF